MSNCSTFDCMNSPNNSSILKKSKLKKLCLWPWLLWLRSRLRPTHPDRTDLDPDSRIQIRTAATTGAHQDWWGQGFEKYETSISLNGNRAWKKKSTWNSFSPIKLSSHVRYIQLTYSWKNNIQDHTSNTQPYYLPESKLSTFTLPRNQGQIEEKLNISYQPNFWITQ